MLITRGALCRLAIAMLALVIAMSNAKAINLYSLHRMMLGFTAENEELWREGLNALQRGNFHATLQNWGRAAEPEHPQGKGYYLAQVGLSVLYQYGLGVETDSNLASEFWDFAAEDRSQFSQEQSIERTLGQVHVILGIVFQEGIGMAVDYERAWTHFIAGSSFGNAYASFRIGQMYEAGMGLSAPHFQGAFEQYKIAAKLGIPDAQHALGEMYKRGTGVPQNYQRSYIWYSIATATRNGEASTASRIERDAMAQLLSQDMLAEAQVLAVECIETDFENCN